jgi:seryl-tRNA synthetase
VSANNALSHVGGHRCYTLLGDAARLERALVKWTLKRLVNDFNFTPVVVPTLVYDDIVSACGFDPHGKRTQVYSVDGLNNYIKTNQEPRSELTRRRSICLAGTSEIPLVSLHLGKRFDVDSGEKPDSLPKKYTAISRCYRAETSNIEKGLYRVHYFTKVEMVSLCRPSESEEILQEFVSIQQKLFDCLGLQFKVIDMPKEELGPAAVKKFDIEAWFPGRNIHGEISSASNCCERQTSKLNIRLRRLRKEDEAVKEGDDVEDPFVEEPVHTVNGTACASPRILLPLIETHQTIDGKIAIPSVLQPDMCGQQFLKKFVI